VGITSRLDQQIALATLGPIASVLVLVGLGLTDSPIQLALVVFGAPHVLATVGLYADRELGPVTRRAPVHYLVVPLLAIPASAAAFALVPDRGLLVIVTATFAWQVHHYSRQNVGVLAFWARARGLGPVTVRERRAITASTLAGVAGVARAVEVVPAWGQQLQLLGLATSAIAIAMALRGGWSQRTAATVVGAGFYLPLLIAAPGFVGVAFAYQAAHGGQYYLMVGRSLRPDRRATRLAIVAVLVGAVPALLLLAPRLLLVAPAIYGIGKGLAMSHFIADARLWRLRDPSLGPILRRRFRLDEPPPRPPALAGSAT
jgi:hypothetical protein